MYKRTFWQDHVEGIQEGTDMNAANFNNIEVGTMEAHALAALNAAHHRYSTDVAKNSEVVVVYEIMELDTVHHIAIPEPATRNNLNYNVVTELDNLEGGVDNQPTASIIVYNKQANGFDACFHGTASAIGVRFCISGGMI